MTLDAKKIAALVVAFVLVLLCGYLVGTCHHTPAPLPTAIETDVDATAGELVIARDLDAEIQFEEEQLRVVEARHAAELASLDQRERADYQTHRARGSSDLARWFKDRTRQLLLDAGAL